MRKTNRDLEMFDYGNYRTVVERAKSDKNGNKKYHVSLFYECDFLGLWSVQAYSALDASDEVLNSYKEENL